VHRTFSTFAALVWDLKFICKLERTPPPKKFLEVVTVLISIVVFVKCIGKNELIVFAFKNLNEVDLNMFDSHAFICRNFNLFKSVDFNTLHYLMAFLFLFCFLEKPSYIFSVIVSDENLGFSII
jgi:hypothetical protein